MMNEFCIKTISSLEKVFPHQELTSQILNEATALKGEIYSLQMAFRSDLRPSDFTVSLKDSGDLSRYISIRKVGLIPSEFVCYPDHDNNILTDTAGLYPDALYSLSEGNIIRSYPGQWRSTWITIRIPEEISTGSRTFSIVMENENHKIRKTAEFTLHILENILPEQKLINTHWFHSDCLATYYGDEIFSEQHWLRLNQQFRNCTSHGMNMLLTPVFTPPLDTKVGGERPTTQLVDVYKKGTEYNFGLSKLNRWIDMALNAGFKYIEISHLATQWGAEFCPKIMAVENGVEKRIFGWDTKSLSSEYIGFLEQFLTQLDHFFIRKGIKEAVYFHVSDEPHIEHLDQFEKISHELRSRLEGYKFIDALSNYEFYTTGAVPTPIPAVDHIEPFIENDVKELWAYYCCEQYKDVPNRFFNMPSARNRIMGILLYKYRIKGFLHWGYNFYYSQFSINKINPFIVSDAAGGFPSGDSYIVYPGENGPIDSLRHEVFFEAIQDLRALELLETLKGREFVMNLLEGDLENELTFKNYPNSAQWILDKRELINKRIAENE